MKEALRILTTSLWQSLKPSSKFWDFKKILGLFVNIKSIRVPSSDLEQVGFLARFVRLKTSVAPNKWFDESEPGFSSSIFKSPAGRVLSYLPSILFRVL